MTGATMHTILPHIVFPHLWRTLGNRFPMAEQQDPQFKRGSWQGAISHWRVLTRLVGIRGRILNGTGSRVILMTFGAEQGLIRSLV